MTLATTANRVSLVGDGVSTNLAFTFPLWAPGDLIVKARAADGTETLQTLNVDYTLSVASYPGNGSATMTVAPAVGVTIVGYRQLSIIQALDLVGGDDFNGNNIEVAFDKLCAMIQQANERADRALLFALTSSQSGMTVPEPVASQLLGWNVAGNGLVNYAPSALSAGQLVTAFVQTLLDDTTAGQFLTTLGISAFVKTLLDDAAAVNFMTTLGVLHGSAAIDFASTATGRSTAGSTITVTGAVAGDIVRLSSTTILAAGGHLDGVVSSANTVTPYYLNLTGGTVDPASMTVLASVWPKSLFGL